MRLLTLAAILVAPLFAPAQESPMTKASADAAAALAMARAKAKVPAYAAKTKAIPYAEAEKIAKKTGKPILVAVGLGCGKVCEQFRPEILTCDETEFGGSREKRALLGIPGKDGVIYFGRQWPTLPSVDEVRKAVQEWKTIHPGMSHLDAAELQDAAAALVIAMVGVQPSEWTELPAGYATICENGVCRIVPVGYAVMPVGSGPTVVYGDAGDGSAFVPRFPVAAAARGRFRGFLARVLHRPVPQAPVRGYYQQAAAAETGPEAFGAAGGGLLERAAVHRVLKHALRSGKLTAEQRAAADKVLADPSIYEAAVSKVHFDLSHGKTTGGGMVVGKLGDGTLLKLIIDNLPQIMAAVMEILKLFMH